MTRVSQVVDGLSHTVAFSERLWGSGGHPLRPDRDYWVIRTGIYGTADDALTSCRIAARPCFDSERLCAGGRSLVLGGPGPDVLYPCPGP